MIMIILHTNNHIMVFSYHDDDYDHNHHNGHNNHNVTEPLRGLEVVPRSLNPEWNETFDLPLARPGRMWGGAVSRVFLDNYIDIMCIYIYSVYIYNVYNII